jgi:hypothetical protein
LNVELPSSDGGDYGSMKGKGKGEIKGIHFQAWTDYEFSRMLKFPVLKTIGI